MNLKSTIASLRSLVICARFALIITLLVGGEFPLLWRKI